MEESQANGIFQKQKVLALMHGGFHLCRFSEYIFPKNFFIPLPKGSSWKMSGSNRSGEFPHSELSDEELWVTRCVSQASPPGFRRFRQHAADFTKFVSCADIKRDNGSAATTLKLQVESRRLWMSHVYDIGSNTSGDWIAIIFIFLFCK